jgi:hypothetical protein
MTARQAEVIIRRVAGYWPTPQLTDEEAIAWTDQLTDPDIDIAVAEALAVIRKAIYAGDVHRPRVGQLAAAVRVERRWKAVHEGTQALAAGRSGAVTPARTRQWVNACRRVLNGERLGEAKAAEGIVE